MEIELKRLQQVLAVARTGSFSRGAEALHITQPALSRSIGILEDRYGFRVFERGRGGATLTSVGKQVVKEAETLLRSARASDHNLRLFSQGDAGRIAVGMGPLIASLALSSIGLRCLRERPELQVQVVTRPADLLYEELSEDRIELLFCSARQLGDKPDLTEEVLGEIEITAIVRAEHELAQGRKVTPGDLSRFPLLSGAEAGSMLTHGQPGGFICDNYEVLRQMVLQSEGVLLASPGLVSSDLASGRLVSLRRIDNNIPDKVPVYMVSRRGETLSPAGGAVRDYLREHLAPE